MNIKNMNLKINFWIMWSVAAIPAFHYTDCTIAHQSGSQFPTCIFHVHHSTYCKLFLVFRYFIIITVLFDYTTMNFKQKLCDCLNCGVI